MSTSAHEVTQLLRAWNSGDEDALEQLIPLVEAELHRLAQIQFRREREGHTLQTTALVNEAYLRLMDWKNVEWQSRAHFFGIAAKLMRRVLVDHARHRDYQKRGGGTIRVSLTEAGEEAIGIEQDIEVIALNNALEELEKFDPWLSRIVELKFFGGLTMDQIAEVMGSSPRTIARDWDFARVWLFQRLSQ